VMFAIDRAGLVGADGPTHAGAFDLSFLRCIPNMTVMAPSDENECRQMLYTAFTLNSPTAVRYPRGSGVGAKIEAEMQALPIGQGRILRRGEKVALLAFGSMVQPALQAAEELNATVADMRFVKPLDEALIKQLMLSHDLLVTVEENVIQGGAGSAVAECLAKLGSAKRLVLLGLPDRFVEHGDPALLLASCGLDVVGIVDAIKRSTRVLYSTIDLAYTVAK
jgi:1-deoxy-D-xylulose-5-phosphate synthase